MKALKIEYLKLLRLANYIMFAIIIVLTAGVAALSFWELHKALLPNTSFLLIALNSLQASLISFILVVFIAVNIGKEYSENTLRKSIIDGYTRSQFFNAKLLLMIVTVIIIYLIQKIILLAGGAISGESKAVSEYLTISVIINTFIKLLSAAIISFFLVFVSRSITVCIVVYFIWNTVEGIIIKMQQEFYPDWKYGIDNYLPLSSMDKVLDSGETHIRAIIFAIGYLFIMLFSSYWLFMKRDIK